MDLGQDNLSDSDLLSALRAEVRGRESSLVREWLAIVSWADRNAVTTVEGAATLVEGVIDTGVPIAGDGAPSVSEFNLMEWRYLIIEPGTYLWISPKGHHFLVGPDGTRALDEP